MDRQTDAYDGKQSIASATNLDEDIKLLLENFDSLQIDARLCGGNKPLVFRDPSHGVLHVPQVALQLLRLDQQLAFHL